jgi:hypothetical protein
MRARLWPAALATLCVLACIGVGFGVAQASIPDSSGIIHACYNRHGRLRVVDISAQNCRKSEQGISWPSTAAAGLTGWQLIQCTYSSDNYGRVTVSGSPLCSATGYDQATILCPSGKVAVQEAGSLLGIQAGGTYVTVNSDGSGAVFETGASPVSDESIQLVCAKGST